MGRDDQPGPLILDISASPCFSQTFECGFQARLRIMKDQDPEPPLAFSASGKDTLRAADLGPCPT